LSFVLISFFALARLPLDTRMPSIADEEETEVKRASLRPALLLI